MLDDALALAYVHGRLEPADRLRGVSELHPVAGEIVGQGGDLGMLGQDGHDRIDGLLGAIEPEEGVAAVHVAAEVGGEIGDLLFCDGEAVGVALAAGKDLEADLEDIRAAEVLGADVAQFGFGFLDVAEFQPATGELEVHAVRMWRDALDHAGKEVWWRAKFQEASFGRSGAFPRRRGEQGPRRPRPSTSVRVLLLEALGAWGVTGWTLRFEYEYRPSG